MSNPTSLPTQDPNDVSLSGKPKRNLKMVLIVSLGVLVLVGVIIQDMLPKEDNKKSKPVITVTENTNLAKELEQQAKNQVPLPLPPDPVLVKTGAGNLDGPEKIAKMEDDRQNSIIASSMTANDVSFKNTPVATKINSKYEDLLSQQAELLNKVASPIGAIGEKEPSLTNEQAFLSKHSKDTFEAPLTAHSAHKGIALYQGHLIRAVLIKGINTDLPGSILAMVTSDVYDHSGSVLVIPKGSRIYGEHSSDVAIGQSKILMATDRIVFPNGQSMSLQSSTVSDLTGFSGVNAKVDNHFFEMFGTSLLVGAVSWLMPSTDRAVTNTTTNGVTTTSGSVIGRALSDTTKGIAERNKNISPTLTASQGQEIMITVGRDIVLKGYKE